jgi:flagellar biosynthesis component FlhA
MFGTGALVVGIIIIVAIVVITDGASRVLPNKSL